MALSVAMVVLGVALVIEAIVGVGGVSVRLLAGVLFVAGGIGRLYVELRRASARAEEDSPEVSTNGHGESDRDVIARRQREELRRGPAGRGRSHR